MLIKSPVTIFNFKPNRNDPVLREFALGYVFFDTLHIGVTPPREFRIIV